MEFDTDKGEIMNFCRSTASAGATMLLSRLAFLLDFDSKNAMFSL
jgi:hypothetical protein